MTNKFGVPTDVQLAQINKLAKRTLSADELFVFTSKSAGDMMIPNRYTRLSPELLQVMVDDGHKGVSFMYNHNWNSRQGLQGVPYGKVFGGRIEASNDEGETVAMYLDKYIARDDDVVDGMSANALIKKVETGILADTSIGFSTDIMKCSICAENYYSRKCRHWRGNTYEMGDGTQKVCTLTAMPPSIILANNNNALFEESIVWDGAYPGAMVTQSRHGDIIETQSGKFSILEDKEELPENTPILGHYHNGNIVTMVKKSDHKKVFNVGGISDAGLSNIHNDFILPVEQSDKFKKIVQSLTGIDDKTAKLKGSDKDMNEKLKKMFSVFGIEVTEDTFVADEILETMAGKWDATVQTIKDSVEPLQTGEGLDAAEYLGIPLSEIAEKLGEGVSGDDLMKLAKEGQEYHKSLSDEAIAMGVRAMGNDFPKETWENSFANMDAKAIKDIMATWKLQAESIPTNRLSNPNAGQGQVQSLPDEAYRV